MVPASELEPHTCPGCGLTGHVPQLVTVRASPQLSTPVTVPQFFWRRLQKEASDSPVHPQTLATLGVPPAQLFGAVHVPQLAVVPQLLVTEPQSLPEHAAPLFGVHPQTFAVPPPPQLAPVPPQVAPQFAVRETPQLSFAVKVPQFFW